MADNTPIKVNVNIFKDPSFQRFLAANTVQQAAVDGRADRKIFTFADELARKEFCRKFGFYIT